MSEPLPSLASLEQLINQRQYGSAEAGLRQLLAATPGAPDVWGLMGVVALRRELVDLAEKYFRAGLVFAPEHPRLNNALGVACNALGRFDEAKAAFEVAIRVAPEYVEPYYNLVTSTKGFGFQEYRPRLEALLARPNVPAPDRARLHFALAHLVDQSGDADGAFAHLIEGNRAMGRRLDRAKQEAEVRDTMAVFDADFLARALPHAHPSRLPVFVFGMPRSGTTLVEQILSAHPEVHGAGEIAHIGHAVANIGRLLESETPYPRVLREADETFLYDLADAYVRNLATAAPDAARVVNKTPFNFWHVGLLSAMFSGATLVHCRRNAEDIALSVFFQMFTEGNEYAFDLEDIALYYRDYQRLMAHWERVLPGRVFHVDYEALVADPEGVSRALIAHVGLEWNDACLDYHQSDRPVRTASLWQVRQKPYRTSVGRAEKYRRHLAPFREVLGRGAADERPGEVVPA